MKPEQANRYLSCFVWQRFRQFTDTLVDAVGYHLRQLEDETKARSEQVVSRITVRTAPDAGRHSGWGHQLSLGYR
jgi:hypothetical protein